MGSDEVIQGGLGLRQLLLRSVPELTRAVVCWAPVLPSAPPRCYFFINLEPAQDPAGASQAPQREAAVVAGALEASWLRPLSSLGPVHAVTHRDRVPHGGIKGVGFHPNTLVNSIMQAPKGFDVE